MIDEKGLLKEIEQLMKESILGDFSSIVVLHKAYCKILDMPKIGEWIPCSERLPKVEDGTEDDDCPEFNVMIEGASVPTTLKHSSDGYWFDDNEEVYTVVAWQPLPEPWEGEKRNVPF